MFLSKLCSPSSRISETLYPINLEFLHVTLSNIIYNVADSFFDVLIRWIFINSPSWFRFGEK